MQSNWRVFFGKAVGDECDVIANFSLVPLVVLLCSLKTPFPTLAFSLFNFLKLRFALFSFFDN